MKTVSRKDFKELSDLDVASLAGIGFAMHSERHFAADPEVTLVRCVPSFFVERRFMGIIEEWLCVFDELIHYERLEKLIMNLKNECEIDFQVAAGIVCGALSKSKKISSKGRSFLARMKKVTSQMHETIVLDEDEKAIQIFGTKSEYETFGLIVRNENPNRKFNISADKKVLEREFVLKNCIWFKFRFVLGVGFRSDVAAAMALGAKNPTDAMRMTFSTYETAHRNYNAIIELKDSGILSKTFWKLAG